MVYDTNIHHIHLTDTLCHPILVKTLTATNVSRLRKLKVPSATLAEANCSLRVCRIHIRNNVAASLHLNASTIRYTLACKQLCWHTGSSQSCTGSSQEDLGRPIQDWEDLCRPVKTTLHPPSDRGNPEQTHCLTHLFVQMPSHLPAWRLMLPLSEGGLAGGAWAVPVPAHTHARFSKWPEGPRPDL